MKARDVSLVWNHLSSMREKFSVHVDFKNKICRVVLLYNFSLESRPSYMCGLEYEVDMFHIPENK